MYSLIPLRTMAEGLGSGNELPAVVLADCLLLNLRALQQAADPVLTGEDHAFGDVRQALIKVLGTQDWGPEMAAEAVAFALEHCVNIRDAMLSVQA
ncbi:hypothetical protein [Nonomuraea endophytica]|uniref:Uncharacterized protein n=1 Tax=Nonomuraea endophytica TaxID=714136 RepID=A0A7W8EHS9_9ACTN|nr:hypothetical protein [Nonomuraea endophytica]MBB5081280.1 hypothetical protein [Nonomuraea endophytica]